MKNGADELIVQRLLRGGDGFIFDCYGVCDCNGEALALASHRRWRQHLPDFGATSYGEIPSGLDAQAEARLFAQSRALLKRLNYHGVFGIEWLYEPTSDTFFLIDLNARPFLTVGHLEYCGLNLPALAYAELAALPVDAMQTTKPLRRALWVDLLRDLESFSQKHSVGEISFWKWFLSVLKCRSYAYFDWRDPGPGVRRAAELISRTIGFLLKKMRPRRGGAQEARLANARITNPHQH
jgi:D-aspartate ligase